MPISDFSVNQYEPFIVFCRFREKKLGSVLFKMDGRVTVNKHFFFSPKRNVLELADYQNQVHQRKVLRE